jgi:hypothetical protein
MPPSARLLADILSKEVHASDLARLNELLGPSETSVSAVKYVEGSSATIDLSQRVEPLGRYVTAILKEAKSTPPEEEEEDKKKKPATAARFTAAKAHSLHRGQGTRAVGA